MGGHLKKENGPGVSLIIKHNAGCFRIQRTILMPSKTIINNTYIAEMYHLFHCIFFSVKICISPCSIYGKNVPAMLKSEGRYITHAHSVSQDITEADAEGRRAEKRGSSCKGSRCCL